MSFVFSPSNMSTFKQCPRKFQAMSITREIQWKATKQKSRGTLIHNCVERALQKGYSSVSNWPENMDMGYVRQLVDNVSQLTSMKGVELFVEHEMCLNDKWQSVDWWADDGYVRAKADVIVKLPDNRLLIADIKSGKVFRDDAFQLRVEALLAKHIFNINQVQYSYWFVDYGKTVKGVCDFSYDFTSVQDVFDLMQKMTESINANDFPASRNMFCKWCQLYRTPECGL